MFVRSVKEAFDQWPALSQGDKASGHNNPKPKPFLRTPRGERKKKAVFVVRAPRGFQLSYTVMLERELSASMDGPWLQRMAEHIGKWRPEGYGREAMPEFSSLLEQDCCSRICWLDRPTEHEWGAWVMCWQESEGVTTQWFKRKFGVPRHTLSGEIHSHAEALEAARQVLRRVKRCWNRWDQSDHPRFDV